jgi:hypothetical protein
MATDAQIQANRQNATKSTGPKTEKGKAKSRLNALKHGGRARTIDVMPVLPHEDPRELEERIQTWIDDWQPRNAIERELVRRGARLSWMLERGERFEAAHLAQRVRLAQRQAGPAAGASAKQMKRVHDLGRKLFYEYRQGMFFAPRPPWVDEPAVFVAGLEETRAGCRWLLDRWGELRTMMERNATWKKRDVYRFLRLLGKQGFEAILDPELNAIFVAFDVIEPGSAELMWEEYRTGLADREQGFCWATAWRELGPRPADKPGAVAVLWEVIQGRIERLNRIAAEFEQIAAAEAAEAADRAAFDPSPAFERHRRHQASLGRELLRTVDTLRRLRKVDVGPILDAAEDQLREEPGGEVEECENATIEAKLESTQEPVIETVTSTFSNCEDDERSRSAAAQGDLSLDEILILAVSSDHSKDHKRNGSPSHEVDSNDRE